MKNKVLYIETSMGFGGSAVSLFELTSNLHNHDSVIAFFSSKDNNFTGLFSNYNTHFLNARFTYLQKAIFYKKLNYIFRYSFIRYFVGKLFTLCSAIEDHLLYIKISNIVKSENISILHINNCINPIPLRVARKLSIPTIVHLRGHVDCAGRKKNEYNKHFHTLIAPTKKIRDFAITALGVDKSKIKVIYNSVNSKLYSLPKKGAAIRKQHNISDDTIVLGMFARIIPMKGQLELTKAVCKLLKDGYNIKCMFVGDVSDGDIGYFNAINEYIEENSFTDSFIFTGYRENAPEYYNAVDITIHGSIANEAFGRVIIESWAAHKPVIATDIPASVELIENNQTGLIVKAENIDELSEAILRLTNNPDERKAIAECGFKRIEETFSSAIVATSVADIYEDLMHQEK
jgi:glycosyltransferase involved in cell wall biosynthesis